MKFPSEYEFIHKISPVEGGEILKSGNKLTGVLVDNAMNLVKNIVPVTGDVEKIAALLASQNNCLAMGLTTVVDAGLRSRTTMKTSCCF